MKFKKPIYVIWYAAEEMGLVGSQYVVRDFKKKNIPVAAAIQFDMTGYAPRNDFTMWLMDDFVNPQLTAYMEALIKEYVKRPVQHSRCGYGCSDHASWTQGGVPAAMQLEEGRGVPGFPALSGSQGRLFPPVSATFGRLRPVQHLTHS